MADEKGTTARLGLTGPALVAALVALMGYGAFVIVMVRSATLEETQWSRLVFIFGSLEALAFAAAGALFGVSVQQDRVAKAEGRAEANEQDAANGRALAAITLADEIGTPAPTEEVFRPGSTEPTDRVPAHERDVSSRHANAARLLFPNLSSD